MTYTVSSGTLNSTIPYHTIVHQIDGIQNGIHCRCCVTTTPDSMDNVQKLTENFIETLPTAADRKSGDPEFFTEVC